MWETIKAMDEPPLPLVTSSMERLTHLIEKAEPILQVGLPQLHFGRTFRATPTFSCRMMRTTGPQNHEETDNDRTQNG